MTGADSSSSPPSVRPVGAESPGPLDADPPRAAPVKGGLNDRERALARWENEGGSVTARA